MSKTVMRRIDMTLLNGDGSVRVMDSGPFWSEDALDWRYNLFLTVEENMMALARLVYNDSAVSFTVSEALSSYIEDRKAIYPKIVAFLPVIKSINESEIPERVKNDLLIKINLELHQLYPYLPS